MTSPDPCKEWKECIIFYTQLIRKHASERFTESTISAEQANIMIEELSKLDAPPHFFVEQLLKEIWNYDNLAIRRDPNVDLPDHIRGIYG